MNDLHDNKMKAHIIAEKMNKITEKFKNNLNIAEDMDIQASDIINYAEEKLKDTRPDDSSYMDLINLQTLLDDFIYIRSTLRENSEQGKSIIKNLCVDISTTDPESLAALITSYAELNKSITDTLKLFIQSYKDISTIITNLEKVKAGFNQTNNTLNINNFSNGQSVIKSTSEIIAKIREKSQYQQN